MKKFATIVAIMMIIVLTGCAENAKLETPPWNKKQQQQMRDKLDISTVPLAQWKY